MRRTPNTTPRTPAPSTLDEKDEHTHEEECNRDAEEENALAFGKVDSHLDLEAITSPNTKHRKGN